MASAPAAGPLASGLAGGWGCIERGGSRRSKLLHDSLRGWKTYQNRSKFIKILIKISKKINQNSILEGLGAIWAPQIRFGTDLDTSWGSTWGRF